jgi:DUF438 domain-containing protein
MIENMTREQLTAVLETLLVDITFIDENDNNSSRIIVRGGKNG